MKISKLHIEKHNQFKDLELDLTYPSGHEKAGQPLDKVCIIGQSGTGKTTLLKILKAFSFPDRFPPDSLPHRWFNSIHPIETQLKTTKSFISGSNKYRSIEYTSIFSPGTIINRDVTTILTNRSFGSYIVNGEIINAGQEKTNENILAAIEELKNQDLFGIFIPEGYKHSFSTVSENNEFIDLRFYDVKNLWFALRETANNYNAEKTLKTQQLYNETKNVNSKLRDKKFEEFKEWEIKNPNPLTQIAQDVLDNILSYLKLKVHTDLTIEIVKNGHLPIAVENLETKEVIQFDLLSSGTQNIIYPSLLFYFYKPKDAMILFDEVENSLYPNIQQIIIDHYTKLIPNNQFFFATHSPIILSSFDPWEIVELKFDKDGYVNQESYYTGERHIDNYKFNPKFLRWDTILTDIFDIETEGNPEREKLIYQLALVNNKLKKLNGKEGSEEIKRTLLTDYKNIATKLRWKND